jgi:hypothetical protein
MILQIEATLLTCENVPKIRLLYGVQRVKHFDTFQTLVAAKGSVN